LYEINFNLSTYKTNVNVLSQNETYEAFVDKIPIEIVVVVSSKFKNINIHWLLSSAKTITRNVYLVD
jgi:hypothetical protein